MVATSAISRGNHSRQARHTGAGRHGALRADRDGDISMDSRSSNKISKHSGRGGARGGARGAPGTTRGSIVSAAAHRHILREAANGDVTMKGARGAPRSSLVELKVTGWEKSLCSTNKDRGVGSLVSWLEKKGSRRLGSSRREVRIRKSRVEGDTLIISVQPEDVQIMTRMSGYSWSGVNVTIKRSDGSSDEPSPPSSEAEKTKIMLRGVLERRYNTDNKFLDLSSLGLDDELRASAIFDTKSTTSKFFPALMRVLELSFDTKNELYAAIESISLANNDLEDLTNVSSLSQTLPKLHNLDLSNNKFANLKAIELFRRRFYHLQHLVITGNPLEQNEPNYGAEMLKWYPNLLKLNNIQVRTEEEIASKAKSTGLPFPIKGPLFQDEGGIVETFVRNFFAGMDSDRMALASVYYDDKSEFSFSVNTSAPRDPAGAARTQPQEWRQYIAHSRNLKKITQLPARINRLFVGTKSISEAMAKMPMTKHPDLTTEARKWMIESHFQTCVPDPSGQSPTGVDGFQVSVHGEFEELNADNGEAKIKRSCDHVFILGPGGSTGVRVHSHQLTIRAYGGAQAFEPEDLAAWSGNSEAQQAIPQNSVPIDGPPELPAGLTVEVAQQMVLELQKRTNMTLDVAKDCLTQVHWDFDNALAAFEVVKATLPPTAFVQ